MSELIITGSFPCSDYIMVDRETGIITDVGHGAPYRAADLALLPSDVIRPGDFNAHSHPEQSIYVEIADKSWELAKWCRETIYKYSTEMTKEHIYNACVRAFSRMLMFGETSVMVSFYCHNNKGNELDRAVIEAANDVGIRLFFGRMNYDIVLESAYPEKQASQRSYYETPDFAAENFKDLLSCESATVKIAPALHSFHANTIEGIIKGINLGFEYGRKVQFHLSEDEGDVNICLRDFGKRPVNVLASLLEEGRILGLSHLVLSDCVWTDDAEKRLIKEHGMEVVINGRMNDRVKAGRADVKKYLSMGIPLYVGTDGEASNDDLSIENELRWLKETHGLSDSDCQKLKMPFTLSGVTVGALDAGCAADFNVIRDGEIIGTYVGGRSVAANGRLASADIAKKAEEYIASLWETKK